MQLVFERSFEKQGSTVKVSNSYCKPENAIMLRTSRGHHDLDIDSAEMGHKETSSKYCQDLHAAGTKKKKKKMEPVFVKHNAPNICLPLREGDNLEETL